MTIKTFSKLVVLLAVIFVGYTYLFSTSISQIEADITTGLVGHWKMDESSWNGTSGEVIDSSGSLNHSTVENNSTTVSGKIERAGEFNGTTQAIIVPSSTYDFQNSDFSFSAWVKTDQLDIGRSIFSVDNGTVSINQAIHLNLKDDGGIRFGFFGDDLDTASSIIQVGSWHHVVATYDATSDTSTVYVDGINRATGTPGPYTGSPSSIIRIGRWIDGNPAYFDGLIDDARIYSRALPASDVTELYESGFDIASDLEGHWKMDEANWSGIVDEVVDSSGNANHGTASAGTTTTIDGKILRAGEFNGSKNISVPSISGLTKDQTKAFWINPSNLTGTENQYILWEGGVSTHWIQLFDHDSDNKLEIRAGFSIGPDSWLDANYEFTVTDQWYHIALTTTAAGEVKLYVDGSFDSGITTLITTPGSSVNFGIGFKGKIDDLRLYSRALVPGEIEALYNLGIYGSNTSCPSSVQARFTAGDLGLVQSGTYSQSVVDGTTFDFSWNAVMNEDAVNIENTFGGQVTLTRPDLSTTTLSSARAVEIPLPPPIGVYQIHARTTNGDLCDTASITIVDDPSNGIVIPPGGITVTTVGGGTDVTVTPSVSTGFVYIRNGGGDIVGKINVDLNSGRDWGAMSVVKDNDLAVNGFGGTAIIHYPGGASSIPGIVGSSFTLYVPRQSGDKYVRICPEISEASELTRNCSGGVNLVEGTSGQYTVTKVTLEARDLWEIAGVTGTGGLGIQEGRVVYIDLDAQPATLPSTISTAPEVAVSTADEFYLSYIPTSTEFGIGDAVDIVIPFDWTGLATCATSTTDADGDATGDGTLAVVDTQIIRYTFTATTTLSLTTGIEICFAATSSPTVGNYSIAMSDTNDGDFAPALIYVGDDNDVTISATIPITLSLRIKEELTTADTNACNLGVLNPGSVNSCSYRIAAGTNISTGLQVFVSADNQLNTAGDTADIDDTAGGATITAGTEEHGIIIDLGTSWTVGGSFSESTDEPMPLTSTLILDAAAAISDSSEVFWNKITHSASVNSGTAGGSYDQLVTYRAWVDT